MPLPVELSILAGLAIFAASLWIPYIIGVNKFLPDNIDPFQRPHDGSALPDWVMRANRAHLNLLEQSLPFAVLILILHQIGGFSSLTAGAAIVYFVLRVAHAACMITGVGQRPFRPIIFTAGWVCILVLGYAVFAASA